MKDYKDLILEEYSSAVNKATEKVAKTREFTTLRALANIAEALKTATANDLSLSFITEAYDDGSYTTRTYFLSAKEFYALSEIVLKELPIGEIKNFGSYIYPIEKLINLLDNNDWPIIKNIKERKDLK